MTKTPQLLEDGWYTLEDIASMVAHEIRNPLGGIKGFASLLERDLADRPDLQELATLMIQGTDKLNEIVTKFVDYARPIRLQLTPTDLLSLIQEVRETLLTKTNQQIRILLTCNEKSLTVSLDVKTIRSSLEQLISNAIQAIGNKGVVMVDLNKDKTHVRLKISDTGRGISPVNLKNIFSPFFGGLGLAEVLKIIRAHEGTIEVESVENEGTAVMIKLPMYHSMKFK